MENLPESIKSLLQHPAIQHLTSSPLASNLAHLHTTYLDPSVAHLKASYVDPSLAHLRSTYLDPYVVQPLAQLLSSMPDLASVLVLLVILFVSFKVLDYTRRAVMFWVWLTMRLIWWGTIISVGLYMYQAGWERVARDLGFVFNFVVDVAEQIYNGVEGSMVKQGDGLNQGYSRRAR